MSFMNFTSRAASSQPVAVPQHISSARLAILPAGDGDSRMPGDRRFENNRKESFPATVLNAGSVEGRGVYADEK